MNKVNFQTKYSVDCFLSVANILSITLITLIVIIFYLEINKAKQNYFVQDLTGKATKMISLDEPNVSTDTLLRWASLAVTSAYTVDFVDHEQTFTNLKKYFTKAGYKNFLIASAARLQTIIKQKLISTAVVAGTPVLLSEGTIYGFYAWRIQLPLLLSYQGASEKSTKQNLAVNVLVMRVPTKEAHAGIGIAQIQDVVMYNN